MKDICLCRTRPGRAISFKLFPAPKLWLCLVFSMLFLTDIAVGQTELIVDADMEMSDTSVWTANRANLAKATSIVFEGSRSLQVIGTSIGGCRAEQTISGLTGGEVFRFQAKMRKGTGGVFIRIVTADLRGFYSSPNAETDWTSIDEEIINPDGNTALVVRLYSNNGTGYFDNVSLAAPGSDPPLEPPSEPIVATFQWINSTYVVAPPELYRVQITQIEPYTEWTDLTTVPYQEGDVTRAELTFESNDPFKIRVRAEGVQAPSTYAESELIDLRRPIEIHITIEVR